MSGSASLWHDSLRLQLSQALSTMIGTKVILTDQAQSAPATETWWLTIQVRQPEPGTIWIGAESSDWKDLGATLLEAAGVEATEEDARSTYLEVVGQAVGGTTRDASGWLAREVLCSPPETGSAPPNSVPSIAVHVQTESVQAVLRIAYEGVLGPGTPKEAHPTRENVGAAALPSRTIELLLDVELPLSISFGRAALPLKDVIKLTSGSIVELNRSVSEPVDVVVNNCVIARGEVVVVEGNYGVRIDRIISREERLRTLR